MIVYILYFLIDVHITHTHMYDKAQFMTFCFKCLLTGGYH